MPWCLIQVKSSTDRILIMCVKILELVQLIWLRGRTYMTSDGRGEGGSAKSDFITKGELKQHLMRGEGGGQKRAKII